MYNSSRKIDTDSEQYFEDRPNPTPGTELDQPKIDQAVLLAKQFKNTVGFGNGGIRKYMRTGGQRTIHSPLHSGLSIP